MVPTTRNEAIAKISRLESMRRLAARWCKRSSGDERGNIAIIAAIVLPVFLGAAGLGFETAGWYQGQRALQNAADSATVAAAANGSSSYATEAQAVATTYGFQNGVSNVTVTATNTATCPSGATNCYSVTISKRVPLYLAQLVGFQGDSTIGSPATPAKTLTAVAVSTQDTTPRSYCILALASSGAEGITTNGAPFANLNGCDVMSNTSATCHGHNLNAGHGDAHDASSGCGVTQDSNLPVVADPYLSLAANIPADPCATYPQEPAKKKDPALPASNQLSGALSWSGTKILCGDVQLTGNVSLTTSAPGAVLVIENGQLDSNGFTLQTLAGSGLTVIFSGTSAGGYAHAPTGGGVFDIAAPTSGAWSGVALYQNPSLTSGVDISAAGNSPTWEITGLVYLPHSSVTFSGAVSKSSNGLSCFDLVVDNITINGTGSILGEGQCDQAGLAMPVGQIPSRGRLVA
jgi:Flp pilus assembly protein TadG